MFPIRPNIQIREGILLLFVLALISACASVPNIVPPLSTVSAQKNNGAFAQLGAETAGRMIEVKSIVADTDSPVVALAFAPSDDELMSAQFDGRVRTMNWQDDKVVANITLPSLSVNATEFDDLGSMVVTAAGNLPASRKYATDFEGIQAWRVRDGGVQAKSIKVSSTNVLATSPQILIAAIAFSRDGQLLFESSGTGIIVIDVAKDQTLFGQGNFDLSGGLGVRDNTIDALALDNRNEYLAVATRASEIVIDQFQGKSFTRDLKRIKVSSFVDVENGKYPVALKFDPTRHWLTLLTTHNAVVFNAQTGVEQLVISFSKPIAVGKLAFNSVGDLLVVGSDNGVQIWDVVGKREIIIPFTEPVYSVAFNHAQTLLAFGAANGTVHLWGVPAK